MRLFIDEAGEKRMRYMATRWVEGETRHYFAARDARALVVCRTGKGRLRDNMNVTLLKLVGRVVDASIGWDERGEQGLVLKPNIGKRHSKATIYRALEGKEHDLTLSQFLEGAP